MSAISSSQSLAGITDAPLVSVIMNCLNCEKYVKEAIDSVYAQTYPNWEIIFWDDVSTDGSAGIAKSYDSRLKFFRGEETVLLGAARNMAIKQARGEFIAFLDCDDIWLPDKLAKQVPLFRDPQVDLVYSDAIFFNAAGMERRHYRCRPYFVGNCFRELLLNYNLVMPTAVIRRSALDHQPYWFDERFQVAEEADLFLRLAYRGKLAMVNEPLARYRVHSASWTWMRGDLFDKEWEQIWLRYRELFPDFDRRFANEINQWYTRQAFHKAKGLWISGNGPAARARLRPYLQNTRILMLYLLSFSPSSLGRLLEARWNVAPQ